MNFYGVLKPGYADMIYQYGRANGSSRQAAAYYRDAYPNCQKFSTYNTI